MGALTSGFRHRYLDVLASVYIYNEHRGYTALDRVLDAVRAVCPDDTRFIKAIEKHRADERKHYLMFKRWFELNRKMPLALDRSVGHIDRFILKAFGCEIDELDTAGIAADPTLFERLCQVIVLTEERGIRQVETLLANPAVREDAAMLKIFEVIHKDEPDHFVPYRGWLENRGLEAAPLRQRWTDFWIHRALINGKIPVIFLNPGLPRMECWPDEA